MAKPAPTVVDDASALTFEAWKILKQEVPGLETRPVLDFLREADADPTKPEYRKVILDQAVLMFNHLYPHMPFKTDIYHFRHPSEFLETDVRPLGRRDRPQYGRRIFRFRVQRQRLEHHRSAMRQHAP